MIRSLLGLLIIAVIFLAGMVVGIGKDGNMSTADSTDSTDSSSISHFETEENAETDLKNEYKDAAVKMDGEDTPSHFTQKIASSLESVVKGFYEAVVQLCYSFANLFF